MKSGRGVEVSLAAPVGRLVGALGALHFAGVEPQAAAVATRSTPWQCQTSPLFHAALGCISALYRRWFFSHFCSPRAFLLLFNEVVHREAGLEQVGAGRRP